MSGTLSIRRCMFLAYTFRAPRTPFPVPIFSHFADQRSHLACPPPRIFNNVHHQLIRLVSLPGEANFIPISRPASSQNLLQPVVKRWCLFPGDVTLVTMVTA